MTIQKNPYGGKKIRIYEHGAQEPAKSLGPPIHPKDWLEKREIYYEKLLGKISNKFAHDKTLTQPHIDIYEIPPDDARGRKFSTIITSGMSDLIQTLPKEIKTEECGRAEILWYMHNPERWMFNFLLILAKLPFQYKSYFWYFHTLENYFPDKYPGSSLKHIIFLPPIYEDESFRKSLILDGTPVNFLWLFPITQEEMEYKLKNGATAFQKLVLDADIDILVFDPYRKCLV